MMHHSSLNANSLLSFVNMILKGPNVEHQFNCQHISCPFYNPTLREAKKSE